MIGSLRAKDCLLQDLSISSYHAGYFDVPQLYWIEFFTSQSTFFQSCQDESSWVEPVLSRG